MPEITLTGCHPEPLMSYLKALGILRLVSEQADPNATACWKNDDLVLNSKFDEDGLVNFFLEEYCPTPIVGPWAGGSGFFGKDNRRAIEAILDSNSDRAINYQNIIKSVKNILQDEGITEKPSDQIKEQLLKRYRRELPDDFIQWLDAAMVLQTDGQVFAPVLGTGGNDGRLDFTQNFMQRIIVLGLFQKQKSKNSAALLKQSLFSVATPNLNNAAIGQFSPGKAGGPNATQGMEGNSLDNPWDFILMLEGTLILAGSIVKKLGIASKDKASFPFTVRNRPIGEASPTEEDTNSARGELWLPMWEHFISYKVLYTFFGEGRSELSGKPAKDSVDFTRAIASLGIDKGIRSFSRYGFMKRSGKAYLATAMDRFIVPDQPRKSVDLLKQIDSWLDSFRRACSAAEAPERLRTALRKIESAIFNYCRYGYQHDLEAIILALGHAEKELALTHGKRAGKEICRPIDKLSSQWLQAITKTHEFEIAFALSGIDDSNHEIGSIRYNIESVKQENRRWRWQEPGPHVVWNSADLPTNMEAVLSRRLMDGARAGCDGLPLDFKKSVSLKTISAFLAGEVDDQRIEELLWGLILIDHKQRYPNELNFTPPNDSLPIPREFALLKLLFLPKPIIRVYNNEMQSWRWRYVKGEEQGHLIIRPEPRILPLLRANRIPDACKIAYQRLRSSGLIPLPGPKPGGIWRENDWEARSTLDPKRLAAALLIPISSPSVHQLIHLITRQDEDIETQNISTEGEFES